MPLRPGAVKSEETGTLRAAPRRSQWTQGDASACSVSATRTLWFSKRTSPQVQRPRTARPPTRAPRHGRRNRHCGSGLGRRLLRRSGLGLQCGHHAQIEGRGGQTRSPQTAQAAGPARRKQRPTVAERARATTAEPAPWALSPWSRAGTSCARDAAHWAVPTYAKSAMTAIARTASTCAAFASCATARTQARTWGRKRRWSLFYGDLAPGVFSTWPLSSVLPRLQQPPGQIPAGGPPRTSAQSSQTWQQRRRRPLFLPSAQNAWWSRTA